MGQAPMIETPRLRLRSHRLDDLGPRIAMTSDAEATRFVGGVQSSEENWHRLARYVGHWALLGYGLFAVEEKASGAYVGEVGLASFHRGLGAEFDPYPEGAWVMAPQAQGKGYAREAMTAAVDWYEAGFGASRMVCIIAPENMPSLALAAKLGFTPFGERMYKDHAVVLHERAGPLHNAAARA